MIVDVDDGTDMCVWHVCHVMLAVCCCVWLCVGVCDMCVAVMAVYCCVLLCVTLCGCV